MLIMLFILHYFLRVTLYSGCDADASLSKEECDSCPERCSSCVGTNNCTECKDGFFGPVCSNKCPVNCLKCISGDKCVSCRYGFSGNICQTNCSKNCVRYNRSTSGHFGHIHLAIGEDVWCYEDGTCKDGCIAGKYGADCSKDCPDKERCHACSQFTGHCKKCMNGTYGKIGNCNKKCGHCKPDKNDEVKCNIVTGDCVYGCSDGYYSLKCDQKCSHCRPPVKCNLNTGFCENVCVDGYFGQRCNKTCEYCLPSQNKSINNPGRCKKSSGNCNFGCVSGFYGNNCEKVCSDKCKNRVCAVRNGHCENGCITGWSGNTCNKSCSNNCRNKFCTQTLRHCEKGCILGKYGHTCNNICSSTCSNKSCDQFSGDCDEGCVHEWYGMKCKYRCSSTCINRSCDQYSGFCDKGCTSNYYGDMCELRCTKYFQGSVCENRSEGYENLFCNETSLLSCSNPFAVGSVGVAVGVATVLVLLFVRLLLKRWFVSRRQHYEEIDMSTRQNVLPIYEEIVENNEISEQRMTTVNHFYMEVDSPQRITQVSEASSRCYYEVPAKRLNGVSKEGTRANTLVPDLKKINGGNNEPDLIANVNSFMSLKSFSRLDQQRASKRYRTSFENSDISTNHLRNFIDVGFKAVSADQLQYLCNMSSLDSVISRKLTRSLSDSERIHYDGVCKTKTNALTTEKLTEDEENIDTLLRNQSKERHAHIYKVHNNIENNTNIKDVSYQTFNSDPPELTKHGRENRQLITKKAKESDLHMIHSSSYVNMELFQTKSFKKCEADRDSDNVNYLHPVF